MENSKRLGDYIYSYYDEYGPSEYVDIAVNVTDATGASRPACTWLSHINNMN